MPLLARLSSTWHSLFRKQQLDQKLDEELQSFLELLAESKIKSGMSPEQARRAALLELGGAEQVKEKVREARIGSVVDTCWQDIRYGVRQIRRNPGFTMVAVLCLGLGIGANTATFTYADALLFRLPNVKEPDRLVRIFAEWTNGLKYGPLSYPDYVDLRDKNDVFTGVIGDAIQPFHMGLGDRNERIWGALVSGNYFSELGVQATLGRTFLPEEDRTPGTHPVAVISYGLWQRRFGADTGVVLKSVMLNGRRFDIIGVAPRGFYGTQTGLGMEIWVPMMMQEMSLGGARLKSRGDNFIPDIIARLKPGVTIAQARASVKTLMANLAKEYAGTNEGKSAELYPESRAGLHPMVREGATGFVGLVFVVVGFILLMACANIAGLLLARAAARRKEIAVRVALGACRVRLIRQLLAESTLLALLAGSFGLLLSMWLTDLLGNLRAPTELPLRLDLSLNTPVLAFALIASLGTGLLFGLAPALATTRPDVFPDLKESLSMGRGKGSRLRKCLVVGQVALSLMLLIGAGMTIRSLENARKVDPGFNPDNLLVASVDLELQNYDEAAGRQFQRSLRERVGSLPGVMSVGMAHAIPLGLVTWQVGVLPEGYEAPKGTSNPSIDCNLVDHGYFEAMGIPILNGRAFLETDNANTAPVVVVNERFALRFWPGQNPIGKRVRTQGREYQVIGVVKTGKYSSLGEAPKPYFYFALGQNYRGTTVLHVRTAGDPRMLLESVRREVRALDASLPVTDLMTMDAALGYALAPARLGAGVVASFAFLALLLASVGLYGVIAYGVSQSVREIGIRIALGGRPADVLKLIVRQGMVLTAIGFGIGIPAAMALTRLMSGLLYGVSPMDPFAYVGAAAILGLSAFLAAFLPAWRATKVQPLVALRDI